MYYFLLFEWSMPIPSPHYTLGIVETLPLFFSTIHLYLGQMRRVGQAQYLCVVYESM